MNGRFTLIAVLLFVGLPAVVSATGTVYGQVFDSATLQPVAGATVTAFNSTTSGAEARVTSNATGDYSFPLPAGTFVVVAEKKVGNETESDEVNVTVTEGARVRIDLLLLPGLPAFEETEIPPALNVSKEQLAPPAPMPQPLLAAIALIAAIIAGILFYWLVMLPSRRKATEEAQTEKRTTAEPQPPLAVVPPSQAAMREDLEAALKVIRENEGRITQKELRKALNVSEAKASLLVAELEERGLVVKIKKGRGNIVKLP